MKLNERILKWNDSYPILAHAVWMSPIGFVGGWIVDWWLGLLCVTLWMSAQEWTDHRVHTRAKTTHSGKYVCGQFNWNGWDWKDWIGGVIGGGLASWVGSIVF